MQKGKQPSYTRAYGSALATLLAVSSAFAGDYSNCAAFLNTERTLEDGTVTTYTHMVTGPFFHNRLYRHPFRLENDGRISPIRIEGVRHQSSHADTETIHVFEYPRPSYRDLISSSQTDVATRPHTQRGTITVTLRAGSIEILDDLSLTDVERHGAEVDYLDNEHPISYEPFVPSGVHTVLAMEDDKCVPWKRTQVLTHRGNPERKAEVISFYMPLCRDVFEFIDRHPETKAWLDADLNSSLTDIFNRRFLEMQELNDGLEEFMSHEGIGAATAENTAYTARKQDPYLLSFGAFFAGDRRSRFQLQLAGFSPVIAANMALGFCYANSLWAVLNDAEVDLDEETQPPGH